MRTAYRSLTVLIFGLLTTDQANAFNPLPLLQAAASITSLVSDQSAKAFTISSEIEALLADLNGESPTERELSAKLRQIEELSAREHPEPETLGHDPRRDRRVQ